MSTGQRLRIGEDMGTYRTKLPTVLHVSSFVASQRLSEATAFSRHTQDVHPTLYPLFFLKRIHP